MFIKGQFTLLFDLTPTFLPLRDTKASLIKEYPHQRKLDSALTAAITRLLYVEYDANIQIDTLRNVITDF